MNMASGSCGSGMRPLWAILGGLLAVGGIAGIIAGGVLGAKGESVCEIRVGKLIFHGSFLYAASHNSNSHFKTIYLIVGQFGKTIERTRHSCACSCLENRNTTTYLQH